MLTSGAGVVFASDWFGGNNWNSWSAWPIFHHDKDAWWLQYHGPQTYTYSWHTKHSILSVIFYWDCRVLRIHFSCGEPFGFRWGDGPWINTD